MTVPELLDVLAGLKISLQLRDGKLIYSAPSGVLSPELKGTIRENKDSLICFLREAASKPDAVFPPLVRASREGRIPLSSAQRRIWFLHRMNPSIPSYNSVFRFDTDRMLEYGRMQECLDGILERHESLRMVFAEEGGIAWQWAGGSARAVLDLVDLSGLGSGESEGVVAAICAREGGHPFSLESGPLLRAKLLRLDADRHVMLVTIHHIVSDAYSANLIYNELAERYAGATDFPALTLQYADFSHWQRGWLNGPDVEKHHAYWRRQLENPPVPVELPTDLPRPMLQAWQGTCVFQEFPRDLIGQASILAHREGATLYMVMLAGFASLLHRISGSGDMVVGTSVSGRELPGLENMVGVFINNLPLRMRVGEGISFRGFLADVKRETLEAFDHQALPFEEMVEKINPERSLNRTPFFSILFDMWESHDDAGRRNAPDCPLRKVPIHNGTTKLDLSLTIEKFKMAIER